MFYNKYIYMYIYGHDESDNHIMMWQKEKEDLTILFFVALIIPDPHENSMERKEFGYIILWFLDLL